MAHPARHHRPIDGDTLAPVDLGLAVKGKVVAELRHGHVRQEPRARPALLDRQARHGRLHDGLAGAAAHLGADMQDAAEAGGHIFQHLALVGTDATEGGAAAPRAHAGCVMHDRLGRQVSRQGHACRRLALGRDRHRRCRSGDRGLRLGRALLDVADQKFELLDLCVELLRRAAEARPPQHGKLVLQLFDHQGLGLDGGFEHREIVLQRAREMAERSGVVGQIGNGARHGPRLPHGPGPQRKMASVSGQGGCSDLSGRHRAPPVDPFHQ